MGGHARAPATVAAAAAWAFATSAFALAYANRDKRDNSTAMAPGAEYRRSSVLSMPTRLSPTATAKGESAAALPCLATQEPGPPARTDNVTTVEMGDIDDEAQHDAHMVSMTDALVPLLRPTSHRSSRPESQAQGVSSRPASVTSTHAIDGGDDGDGHEQQLITTEEGDERAQSAQAESMAPATTVAEKLASLPSSDISINATNAASVKGPDLVEAVRLVQRANMRYDPTIVAAMRKVCRPPSTGGQLDCCLGSHR